MLDSDGAAPVHEDEFHLWPEHERALLLWFAVQTQWRCDFGDVVGLDYDGVETVMRRRFRVRGTEADRLFAQLQVMERAALDEWARRRAAAAAR